MAVAEERSFRRAAARLNLTPSTLSHSLRALEERLGVRLINRTTRTVAPTTAGANLLAELAPAFKAVEVAVETVNAFRARPQGRLRLTVPRGGATTVLAPCFAAFNQTYPDVTLEAVVDDRFVDIIKEGFDADIRLGESLEQDMDSVRVSADLSAAAVASPAYFVRHPPPQTPHDLRAHRCINRRLPGSGALYRWEFAKGEKRLNVLVDGPLVVDGDELMLTAAVGDVGIAFVSEPDARAHLASGRLVRVLEDWCPPMFAFHLYFLRNRQSSASLRALIDTLTAHLAGAPAGARSGERE